MSRQIRPSLSVGAWSMSFRGVPGKTARTDVRMVYLGKEAHFGRCHGVLFRQEQFELENTIYTRIRDSTTMAKITGVL